MLAPFAIQRGPLPPTNYAPGGTPKIGVVIHVIEGSADSAMAEFHNVGAELSAHFVVAGPGDPYLDGTILQLLDTDLCAYAQAAGNYPPTSYIAVEFSGTVATPMSAEQLLAAAKIVSWASLEHGFPIVGEVPHGTPGVTTHCNPDGSPDPNWGDHPCPGPLRLAQIPLIVATANELAHPPKPTPPPQPPPPQEFNMITSTPSGNGYWVLHPDGSVWSYGDAKYFGGLNPGAPVGGGALPAGQTAISIESHPGGEGYWILSSQHQVYAFGAAAYHGAPIS